MVASMEKHLLLIHRKAIPCRNDAESLVAENRLRLTDVGSVLSFRRLVSFGWLCRQITAAVNTLLADPGFVIEEMSRAYGPYANSAFIAAAVRTGRNEEHATAIHIGGSTAGSGFVVARNALKTLVSGPQTRAGRDWGIHIIVDTPGRISVAST